MFDKSILHNILFLDIETVPQYAEYNQLPEHWKKLWDKKAITLKPDENQTPADIYARAGIYAEFGKIVCISVGGIYGKGQNHKLRIKSFYGENEKQLLEEFAVFLTSDTNKTRLLCAHNGKEFDFPYLCRRMLINGIELPPILNIAGKKPWEVTHIDTMEIWKFGDYKSYTSLDLLASVFNIPTPKDDINGSQVWSVYWIDKDLERIKTYCQKDVVTIAQLVLKLCKEKPIQEEDINYATS